MKFTKPLDKILNTEAKIRILRFLCRTNAEWNGSQIAKEIRITPAATHTALRVLQKEGLLTLRNMGKTHVYSLKEGFFLVSDLLKPLFTKEDHILDTVIALIKRKISSSKVKGDIASVALFGSVGACQERPTSDIDLVVVVENAKARPEVARLFREVDERISKQFGNILSPYVNTRNEFKTKYKKGLVVIKNILKTYRLIYGGRLETLL
ncbi:MAG TPA: nucleotidyltransferase domain-containing protein [Candidatus Omnitrophota bacterium]|nr:nucleotidyltransferase domain-containing protein [Candidatus Omnitrophota bacterium]